MSSESILGLEANSAEAPEQTSGEANVDARLNTLRETVLQLLEEVESLAISRPVDIKRGARFSPQFSLSEPMVTLAMNPSRQAHGLADISDPQRGAGVGTIGVHDAVLG